MRNEIQRFREYLDSKEGRHKLLAEAAKKNGTVTLNKEYLKEVEFYSHKNPRSTTMPLHQKNQYGKTFFKEVTVAPPRMTEAVRLYSQNPNLEFSKTPLKSLIKIIENGWDSDIFHVFLHSSGYDSRLISGILMKLREKHGEGWIGDIVFVCWEPGGAPFKKIMEWEGWKKHQYHVYREGVGIDYRSEVVDFKMAWRWVNDYSLPHFCAGPAIEEAIEKGLIPKGIKTCLVSGLSSEAFAVGKLLDKYRNQLFDHLITDTISNSIYAAWSAIPFTETFIPFLNIELATANSTHPKRMKYLREFSTPLLKLKRCPQNVEYSKPNWINAPAGLSEKTRTKAAKDFNNSWFAKETNQPEAHHSPDINHGMYEEHDKWWRTYVLASTFEYLIKQGVKIKL